MTTTILSASELVIRYGAVEAVRGISLEVAPASVVCLLGANGAGKSSAFLALTGLLPTASGRIEVRGQNATGRDARWFLRHGVTLVPEGQQNFSSLTVQANLTMPAMSLGNKKPDPLFDRVYDLFPVLAERRDQRAGTLSGGEQKMLAIGRGLVAEPDTLFIDEPTLGLAPVVIERIAVALERLKEEGIAIVVAEQNLRFAERLGGRTSIVERGRIIWEGDSHGVGDRPEARAALLGQGVTASGVPADNKKQTKKGRTTA